MALKVLTKAMDTTAPTADKVEVVVLSRSKLENAECIQRVLSNQEVTAYLKEIAAQTTTTGDV
jgi:20S proteasome subunit alpha 3